MKEKVVYASLALALALVAMGIAKLAPEFVGSLAVPIVGVVVAIAAYLRPPPPSGGAAALLLAVTAGATSGCALFNAKTIRGALDATQIACVMQSELVQEDSLAKVCQVADDLLPVLRELVATRDAARKAGVKYGDAAMGIK